MSAAGAGTALDCGPGEMLPRVLSLRRERSTATKRRPLLEILGKQNVRSVTVRSNDLSDLRPGEGIVTDWRN